ncbi:hypothetical protein [Xaviernesmea oryzae]|uniref:hypothetical protein n=1 Tax=Rhizobium/Agrobacterium group TaxID=227290 RepID=UPI00117A5728|nr:hypothetical protein [Xaviernesmea oryzae]
MDDDRDFKWRRNVMLANQPWLMDVLSRGMRMQLRRSIADRVIARARRRGMPIDDDMEYMALVEQWVEGEIEIGEMRQRYIDLLARRSAERKARREDPAFIESSQIAAAPSPLVDTSNRTTSTADDEAAVVSGDAAKGPPPEKA